MFVMFAFQSTVFVLFVHDLFDDELSFRDELFFSGSIALKPFGGGRYVYLRSYHYLELLHRRPR